MVDVDNHHVVGQALKTLSSGLSPFVSQVLNRLLPPGTEWPDLLRQKDAVNGRGGNRDYQSTDLALMLRAMTERLGNFGYPFNGQMPRQAENYAKELREVRNTWAHTGTFTTGEAFRAVDSAELLLRAIGATTQAGTVATLKAALGPAAAAPAAVAEPGADRPIPAATVPRHGTSDAASAQIRIAAIDDLSYAMAHCKIPVVDHITVENTGADVHGAFLEVDVVSAQGSHGGPTELHLDLGAGRSTDLTAVNLKLDPAAMLTVEEQRPGEIRVALKNAAGDLLAHASREVNILAASQWKATPRQLALELLAAYVQPNAAAVTAFMPEVSDRLKETTGNSAIDGYQSDNPERVDAIVRAVFEAMRARDIRYSEPPASWGDIGQKVRTPAEVLDGRLGTCLDTTLVMAAALEQAGINTTVWVLAGHAMLGYWRVDASLGAVSTTEPADLINQVDLGNIGLVETTMVTQSAVDASFDDACRAPRAGHRLDDLSNILGATDIRQARQAHIIPLPSRTTDPDGNVVVTTYAAGAGRAIAPYTPSAAKHAREANAVPGRVQQWKNALLDLSLRNKLINYTERAGFRIEVPGPILGYLEDALHNQTSVTLLGSDELQSVDTARGIRFGRDLPEADRQYLLADKRSAYIDITAASYKTKLRYLANKAKTIVQETGANNLYLAFGMLNWRFNDRELRSPLVLVPVTLTPKNKGERYTLTIDEAGTSTPNYCLVEKLRTALGLEIPALANPAEDDSGIDLDGTFRAVREAIADAGLPFHVESTAHLTILQFAKYPLWKDLDDSWNQLSRNSLVQHLITGGLDAYDDPVTHADTDAVPDLDALGVAVPMSADASQLRAVADAVGGQTFVLEGPPGTGKSQTITNLLAHAMATGRRVLFVAEKRAALDVVKKRLESVGLGELSLDIHDKSARPAAVREQIRRALELRISHDPDLLRTSLQSSEASRARLARYAARLHQTNAAGYSLYTAQNRTLAPGQDVQPLPVPKTLVATGTPELLQAVSDVMRQLSDKTDWARPRPEHPWAFVDTLPAGGLDAAAIHTAAVEFDTALEQVQQHGVSLDALATNESVIGIDAWARVTAEPRYPLEGVDALHTAAGQQQLSAIEHLLHTIAGTEPEWFATATPSAVDLDIPDIHAAAVAADESGFFGRKKRRRAVLAQLTDVLAVEAATVKLKTLSATTGAINDSYAAVATLRDAVAALPVTVFDRPWNPYVADDATHLRDTIAALRRVSAILSAKPDVPRIAALRKFYAANASGAAAVQLKALAGGWEKLSATTGTNSATQTTWAGDRSFLHQWWATRGERSLNTSASIERWVDLLAHVEPLRAAGMDGVRTDILAGAIDAEDAPQAYDLGVAVASIAERLETSELGSFDVTAHMKSIRRFTDSSSTIRDELKRSIGAAMLGSRKFNADGRIGRMGHLRKELDRKRGGSVRALLENYGDLITQIMPCTLTSPDSVARFFPAQADLFDVVVFDEASQIRVADAVGAMGRATSVVVVGDSKQMPPTSFAEVSAAAADDDEAETPELSADEESILTECVKAMVPQQWLTWHYRSQDEELIAFSNLHYYNGRLASFPAPVNPGGGRGVSLVRVDGHFERAGKGKTLRTNRAEAERIVADIRLRFAASPDAAPSLGVITFNTQQRDLIENLLRDTGDDRLLHALEEPDGLFVKNLENVQGDERDTILFSVAFSKDHKGVVPLNFGPLSRAGGERRLNVAVTRARCEVVLYASFDPADLRAEETTQIGTKHLKAYLELAARGVETITQDGRRNPVIDRHRDDIADALRAAGLIVQTDIGLSDFRVDLVLSDPAEPARPLVAVLLDGVEWRSRHTVADRDGLPVDVLSTVLRWPAVERVWMPEWLHHRAATITRLQAAVTAARQKSTQPVEPAPRVNHAPAIDQVQPTEPSWTVESFAAPATTGDSEELVTIRSAPAAASLVARGWTEPAAPAPTVHPHVIDFKPWKPWIAGDRSVLDELYGRGGARVVPIIREVIEAEAPIHRDQLARFVAGAFGLSKVNEDRKRSLQNLVPAEYRRATDSDFYWPVDVSPDSWRLVRVPQPGVSRPLDGVSLVEIGNAMVVVAEQTGGIDQDDLKREAMRMFGVARMGQQVAARLADALQLALTKGTLVRSASGVVVVR